MKPVCEKCPLPIKTKDVCQRRQCQHAEPLPSPPTPPSRFPIGEGSTIDTGDCRLYVEHMRGDTGDFDARVEYLKDKDQGHGHWGSYVTEGRYYRFTLNHEYPGDILWEVLDQGTERFHREGSTGAQFLLYWSNDGGFSLDLDS
jgi:hypothetical protein